MYRLFLDETGGVDEPACNDPATRFVNLTGVILKETDYEQTIIPDFNSTRSNHFGHHPDRPIVLHRQMMASRKGIFRILGDPAKRDLWLQDQDRMLTEYPITVISVSMDKIAFYYENPNWRGSPYGLCAFNLIERFCLFLYHHRAKGRVTAEMRHPKKDKIFEAEYARFLESGNRFIPAQRAQFHLGAHPVEIVGKNNDIIGVQLADLVCKPSLSASRRYFTGVDDFSSWNIRIARAVWRKYYRDRHGRLSGCGLVWRPQRKSVPR